MSRRGNDAKTVCGLPGIRIKRPHPISEHAMLENMESGEVLIFVTPSIGGQRAVREVCDKFAKRTKKGEYGQPIIKLGTAEMPSKKYGKVPRPAFEIVGWDNAETNSHEISDAAIPVEKVVVKHDDMDDEIPF